MSNFSTRMRVEAARSLAFGSIAAGYTAVGTPFTHPISIVYFFNSTNESVWISFDGSVDHVPLAAGSFFLLDVTTNKANQIGLFIEIGTQIYTKQLSGAPTSGSVYVSSFYAQSSQ